MSNAIKKEKQKRWFHLQSDGCLEYFETKAEAMKAARQDIQDCNDGDGWSEEVENIAVGFVTHETAQANIKRREDQSADELEAWSDEWEYLCDYELCEVSE